jgi:SAM-dependent methyltransferase
MSHLTGAATRPDHFATGGRSWSKLGYPLRPSTDDTAVVHGLIRGLAPEGPLRVLVLGLTRETVEIPWPKETALTAIDHSPAMIEKLWPAPEGPAEAKVVLGDWCAMPLGAEAFDLVAGDGCFALLEYPRGYDLALSEVHRVLDPNGRFAIRLFTRPETAPTVEEVGSALGRGEVKSVNSLKLRLWAAVHGKTGRGVRIHDVWEAWDSIRDKVVVSEDRPGFTPEEISGIENYQGQETRYELPTLAEFRATAGRWFIEVRAVPGTGDLGDWCPTLVLAPV